MKEISFSVPTGTFPGAVGDRVRVNLTGIMGLELLETVVVSFTTGCGASDQVVLRYDEDILPAGITNLSQCHLEGFHVLCDCCSARPCVEVFAPTQLVVNGTFYMMTMPGDFRLDQIKFFNPTQEPIAYGDQIVDEFGNRMIDQSANLITT